MNCKQVNQFIVERLGEELPADVQAHLDQCAACGLLYTQQLMIKDLFSLRSYEEPKSGRVERGVANIMREVRLREDRYEERQSRFLWIFSEPRYGIALLFLVFVGLNLARTDYGQGAHVMMQQNDLFGSKIESLNEYPQVETANGYDYPEFEMDKITGVTLPRLATPIKLVNFSEDE